jgi:hypothetical protein
VTVIARQWRSVDGLVHIMRLRYGSYRAACYGPYAPLADTRLSDDAPTCLRCVYNDTYYGVRE